MKNQQLIMKIQTGHLFDTHANNYKDWVIGPFVKEKDFSSENFEVKFQRGKKGLIREPKKVLNENVKTLAVAIYGNIRINFGEEDIHMKKEGDYIYWSPDRPHEFEFIEDGLVISIRWNA